MADENRVFWLTMIWVFIVFCIGFLAGTQYNVPSTCNSRLNTCNALLDYCSESNNNIMPKNCSNPIYRSDNYWYCEVN